MLRYSKKGQAILEYAILLGVVIAALLIMQVFVKRGFQGGLKDSADKMGEQFSGSSTTLEQKRTMAGDQTIVEEVATDSTINAFGASATGTVDKGAYSYTKRSGGDTTSETKTATDAATQEKTRWSDYQTTSNPDFNAPF